MAASWKGSPSEIRSSAIEADNLYNYGALKDNEIRVLRIKSAENCDDAIECTMVLLKGETAVSGLVFPRQHYCTMSYAWGETFSDGSHLTQYILCDGKHLPVTQHLWCGLRRFRSFQSEGKRRIRDSFTRQTFELRDLALWVDCICINQQDDVEKGQQIWIMAQIFRTSAALIVWLGEPNDRHEDGQIRRFCEVAAKRVWSERELFAQTDALSIIFKNTWFERRWVVQEVSLRKVWYDGDTVLVGSQHFTLRDLIRQLSSDGILKNPSHRKELKGAIDVLGRMDLIGTRWRGGNWVYQARGLISTMLLHHDTKCSKDHDLIYALMHLCYDIDRYRIEVDYATPVDDLFYHIARTVVLQPVSREELLLLLALGTTHKSDSKTPTWVPDWRVSRTFWCHEHQDALAYLARDNSPDRYDWRDEYEDEPARLGFHNSRKGDKWRLSYATAEACEVLGQCIVAKAWSCGWSEGMEIQHPSSCPCSRHRNFVSTDHPADLPWAGNLESSEEWKALVTRGLEQRWILVALFDVESHVKFILESTNDKLPGRDLPLYKLLFCVYCNPWYPLVRKKPMTIAIA